MPSLNKNQVRKPEDLNHGGLCIKAYWLVKVNAPLAYGVFMSSPLASQVRKPKLKFKKKKFPILKKD